MSSTSRLHHEVHGGSGTHLLLVHGLLSSRAQWQANLPALSKRWRCVVVELLGHGRSPAPESPEAYSPDAYVAEFERIRASLGADRWLVCGQSLGAALTLRYGLEHPERVIAQVFTNSNSALAPEDWGRASRPAMEHFAGQIAERGREAIEALPIHPRHATRLPEPIRNALVADCRLHSPVGVARTAVHTVVPSSVRSRIASNRVPTLLVRGGREKRFVEHAAFANKTMPQLSERVLDAGHAVNIEATTEFDAALAAFFGEAERA